MLSDELSRIMARLGVDETEIEEDLRFQIFCRKIDQMEVLLQKLANYTETIHPYDTGIVSKELK